MSLKLILEWTIFIGGIMAFAYTMFVIMDEKESYLESAIKIPFKDFTLPIPSWWGEIKIEDDYIRYERTDTRYDWVAEFLWLNPTEEQWAKDLEAVMVEKLQELNLVFDTDSSIIKNPTDFHDHPAIKNNELEIVHIEGTATENEEERVYYDTYLIKDLVNKGFFFAKSRSSVLNGAVEGPYFEEVMLNFEFNSSKS